MLGDYRCGSASSWLIPALALCLLSSIALAQTPLELLNHAAAEANKLREPAERALVLADLARTQKTMGDERWSSNLTAAVATAEVVEDALARTMTWRGVAVRGWGLDRKLAEESRDNALSEARRLPYAAQQSLALREIGRSLLEVDPSSAKTAFAGAQSAAGKIDSPLLRAAALRDLATALVPLDPSQADKLFTQAATDLAAIVPAEEPVQLARVELLVSWSRSNLQTALKEASEITDERLREVAYRRVVEALAPMNPESAMQVAAKLAAPGQRGLALAAVASSLAKVQPDAAAGMARSAATMTQGLAPEDAARLQATVVSAIAAADIREALLLASRIDDEEQAARAVSEIALVIAKTDPAQAAKLVAEITDWEIREAVQAQLAPVLAGKDLPAALEIVNTILSRRDRVHALLAIVEVMGCSTKP